MPPLSPVRLFVVVACASLSLPAAAADAVKRESFDRDPGWEAFNNHVVPEKVRTITQAFGFSPNTTFASTKPGEVGGLVTRTPELASYAAEIPACTLDEPLTASGVFTFAETGSGGGVFVGFFYDQQPDTARPLNSLGMNLDTENTGGRLAVRLITATNQSCGEFVTHFVPGGFRPTPLRKGTRYRWSLRYDPAANDGNGRFEFSLEGFAPGDPIKSPIRVDLPAGFEQLGTKFNRFGIMNMRKAGGTLRLYLADVKVNDRAWDFASDPKWIGVGNQTSFRETEPIGAHDFGYRDSALAGGKPGEIGGTIWRTTYASYADRVGPLTLDQPLVARGRVVFTGADPDSGAYFGWFNSAAQKGGEHPRGDFLGIHLEGPTRVGHYFQPQIVTAKGSRAEPGKGAVLRPDSKPHTWSIAYDPAAEEGRGAVTVTLDAERSTFALPRGRRAEGAQFDRFGFFSSRIGGSRVKVFLDDLEYTAAP